MYNFPDKIRSGDIFNATVLGLVKAVQASLTIFGMFDLNYERNGLLCDITVDGIQKWIAEIGEPHVHVEVGAFLRYVFTLLTQSQPMERVADPTIVSALLSLVFTMRNKLHDLGQVNRPLPQFLKTLIINAGSPPRSVPRTSTICQLSRILPLLLTE